MSELTSQQIWDMNKMIARACGWVESKDYDGCPIYRDLAGRKDRVFEGDHLIDDLTFDPSADWNDFFIAYQDLRMYGINIEQIGDKFKTFLSRGSSSGISSSVHTTLLESAYVAMCNYVKEFHNEEASE